MAEIGTPLENDTPRPGERGGDALVLALAAGLSVPAAARQAGVSTRTAYRRLEDAGFRRAVGRAREDLLARAVGQLADAAGRAVSTLRGNLKAKDRAVANRAALGILQNLFRGIEVTELAERLEAVEERVGDKR